MDQSKNLVAKVENPGGPELYRGRLLVNIGEPNLQASLSLPDEVSAGATISVTVSNQPSQLAPAGTAVNGTLALELFFTHRRLAVGEPTANSCDWRDPVRSGAVCGRTAG